MVVGGHLGLSVPDCQKCYLGRKSPRLKKVVSVEINDMNALRASVVGYFVSLQITFLEKNWNSIFKVSDFFLNFF